MKIMDKIGDMYFCELNELSDEDYKTDTKKIEQNIKVFNTLIDMLDEMPELQDIAEQIRLASCSCSHTAEIRAYKMGLSFGQTISGVKN